MTVSCGWWIVPGVDVQTILHWHTCLPNGMAGPANRPSKAWTCWTTSSCEILWAHVHSKNAVQPYWMISPWSLVRQRSGNIWAYHPTSSSPSSVSTWLELAPPVPEEVPQRALLVERVEAMPERIAAALRGSWARSVDHRETSSVFTQWN